MERRRLILLIAIIILVCAPFVLMKLGEKGDPFGVNTDIRYSPPGQNIYFGTDSLGRNMTARTLYAVHPSTK
jgi:ABC-type dipeptide/oligopeptide/nickel transport system permease subunit